MTDPFVGQLAFFRVYSGHVESGDTVLNSTKGTHRAHRPPAEDARQQARGDQGSLGGRHRAPPSACKNVTTGDTICDPKTPGRARVDELPGAGHRGRRSSRRRRPTRRSSASALGQADAGRPDLPGPHGQGHGPDHHLRHGRAAPRDHRRPPGARVQRRRQRRQAAGRLPRDDHPGGRGRGQASSARPAAAASTATSRSRMRADHRGAISCSTTRSSAARSRRSSSSRSSRASRRRWRRGIARRLPDDGRRGRPLRRQLPRRRLLRDGVQDRRLDGLPGRLQEGAAGPHGADHGGRGRDARGLHGRRHRRHHLAPRPHPAAWRRAAAPR